MGYLEIGDNGVVWQHLLQQPAQVWTIPAPIACLAQLVQQTLLGLRASCFECAVKSLVGA